MRSVFRYATHDVVTFGVPSMERSVRDEGFWRLDVLIPLHADEEVDRPAQTALAGDTWPELLASVRGSFVDLIETGMGISVQYDDQPHENPADDPWIRLTILSAGDDVFEISGRYQTVGLMVAQVFVPLEEGTYRSLPLAESVAKSFQATRYGAVEFGAAEIVQVGRPTYGVGILQHSAAWWQTNVRVPWYAEQAG